MLINVQTHTHKYKQSVSLDTYTHEHAFYLTLPYLYAHTHTRACPHTHTHVLNTSLPIRTNGTEHLYFLIRALKLSYLNVSPSIVAAHHFHSNPPKEMNWNFSLSLFQLHYKVLSAY